MGSQWNAGSDKKGTSVKIIAVEGIVHISEFSYLYVISAIAVIGWPQCPIIIIGQVSDFISSVGRALLCSLIIIYGPETESQAIFGLNPIYFNYLAHFTGIRTENSNFN